MGQAKRESSGSGGTRRSYDRVAERYAVEIGDELAGKPLDRTLLNLMAELAAGGLVADIGCGPGQVTTYLASRSARMVGLDLSPAMCRIGRRRTALPFCAADMTALPVGSGALTGIVCLYAVIHLDDAQRAAAYREFARTLTPGGHLLLAFHTSDADLPSGGRREMTTWWGFDVELNFRFLDPADEVRALGAAGLRTLARIDREPYPEGEHQSRRCYLLAQLPAA